MCSNFTKMGVYRKVFPYMYLRDIYGQHSRRSKYITKWVLTKEVVTENIDLVYESVVEDSKMFITGY